MQNTINLQQATASLWDVIIVGAGVAGASAAITMGRSGLRVLLVDRKQFPRSKVCGACLNNDAIAGLAALGVLDDMRQAGAISLGAYRIQSGSQGVTLQLPGGLSISRRTMDQILVEQAIAGGCHFLSGTALRLTHDSQPGSQVTDAYRSLWDASGKQTLRAKIVILATGLASEHGDDRPELRVDKAPHSRIGFGISTRSFPQDYLPGIIYMAVGRNGYVGASRTEGDQLNIAAAIDRDALSGASPAEVCGAILREARFPVGDDMLSGTWQGTTTLTRRRQQIAADRLFVVGDAAGYIEPFTGEGMAWAIRGGRAVAPLAMEAATQGWCEDFVARWVQVSESLITNQQNWCHTFAQALRYPKLVRGLLGLVKLVPPLGQLVVRQINRERKHEVFDRRLGDCVGSGNR
ncbi:MAG: FAD-dependent monooxygenase [Pirellulaceae bacterium]